jgi:predicted alpha/beta-fold hydrolase
MLVSLDFPEFRPHPLLRGGHLQTIAGAYLPHGLQFGSTVHQVALPDGDAIALHEDESTADPSRKIAILLHGLGGSHQSGYVLRASAKLRSRGVHVFRMDLRGCGAGIALARHPLNAGRSEDAAAVLNFVHEKYPAAPIHLVGFSMGGNIALKLAGELGAAAPPHLASVMAVCPPIDLAECTRNIQRGINRLYDRRFVRTLIDHIQQRDVLLPTAHSRPLIPCPQRLMDFDSLFTAPLSGYADVHDYYARASSGPVLAQVAVPTLIVTAASDPIVPVACFERACYSASTNLVIAPCGGHLGFVAAGKNDPDSRWLDWRIVDWVTSH